MAKVKTKAPKKESKDRGRPTRYTKNVAAEICERLSLGETLNQICRDEHLPSRPTIIRWVLEDRDGFSDRYTQARDLMLETWADQTIDIADDGTNDWMDKATKSGDVITVIDHEHVTRSRLRVDTRKWMVSRLKPEKYGDRLEVGGKLNVGIGRVLDEIDGNGPRIPTAR